MELFESLSAAAAEAAEHGGGPATAFQPHLGSGVLEDGLSEGTLMRVCVLHSPSRRRLRTGQSHESSSGGLAA